MPLYLEHYQKALEIFKDPAFEEQELLLAYYNDPIFKNKEGYTDNGIHWGYVDDLVARLTNQDKDRYSNYAFIVNEQFIATGDASRYYNYPKVKFREIKNAVFSIMKRKIDQAQIDENNFLSTMKPKEEIHIPLTFDKDYVLVSFSDNYADEFDIEGWRVFSVDEWETWKNNLEDDDISYYFGTNENIEYSSKSELLNCFTIQALTTEQSKMLFDLFGKNSIQCLEWNGRYHNKILHFQVAESGIFPYRLGNKEDD